MSRGKSSDMLFPLDDNCELVIELNVLRMQLLHASCRPMCAGTVKSGEDGTS